LALSPLSFAAKGRGLARLPFMVSLLNHQLKNKYLVFVANLTYNKKQMLKLITRKKIKNIKKQITNLSPRFSDNRKPTSRTGIYSAGRLLAMRTVSSVFLYYIFY
jgi:hypothetical protein